MSEPTTEPTMDMINLDEILCHPAFGGHFAIDPTRGPRGWRIINSQRAEFVLETAERTDAQFVCDLLNLATIQLQDEEDDSHEWGDHGND
jgi:hypothetical protein